MTRLPGDGDAVSVDAGDRTVPLSVVGAGDGTLGDGDGDGGVMLGAALDDVSGLAAGGGVGLGLSVDAGAGVGAAVGSPSAWTVIKMAKDKVTKTALTNPINKSS